MVSDNVIGRILLFFCLFSLPLLNIHAQTNAAPGQIRPALQILDSTKEQDGLVGSVRRVRTEYAKITVKEGQQIEGPRQLLEVTTYGVKGNRVENVSYPIADSAVGREEYKYDDHGNIVEKVLRDESGAVLSRESYEYVFDNIGNWTKMVTSLVVVENGEFKREATEVTYRTLTYYAGDAIPRAAASATRERAVLKPLSESNSDRTEKPLDSVNASKPATQPKVDEVQTTPPTAANTAIEKKDGPATGHASQLVSQSAVGIPTAGVMTPVTETVSAGSNSSAEKPLPAAHKSPETGNTSALTTEPGLSKGAKKSNTEESSSPVNPVRQPEPEKNRETKKVATDSSTQPAAASFIATPVNISKSTSTGEPTDSNRASENPRSPDLGNAGSPTSERAESANAASSESLAKAIEFYRLGRQRFEAGDVSSAISAYLESIRLEPNSAEIHMNLGHAYLTSKKDKDAVKAFKEAVRLNPDLAEAHYGLGFVSFRLTRYKDAMDAFKKATVLVPNMAKAHYGLALAYQELGKLDLLVQEQRLLQRLDPKLANKLVQAFSDVDFSCRQSGTRYCR